jgi:hypothetical protein
LRAPAPSMIDLRPKEAAAARPANPAPPAKTGFSNSASRGRNEVALDTDVGGCDVDIAKGVDNFCCSCKAEDEAVTSRRAWYAIHRQKDGKKSMLATSGQTRT